MQYLQIFGLSEKFLEFNPSDWGLQEAYMKNKMNVQSVKVFNNLAERAVALIQEFNSSLISSEDQKQYLLQVVKDHRSKFSAPTKSAAIDRKQSE